MPEGRDQPLWPANTFIFDKFEVQLLGAITRCPYRGGVRVWAFRVGVRATMHCVRIRARSMSVRVLRLQYLSLPEKVFKWFVGRDADINVGLL